MLPPVVVYVFTALAAVVVVLTRARAGLARGPLAVHTIAGVLAILAWMTFLLGADRLGEDAVTLIGLFALVCWWITVVAGLVILMRWLPARGRHAGPSDATSRTGPALPVLAHVGLLVAVGVLSYAYPTW